MSTYDNHPSVGDVVEVPSGLGWVRVVVERVRAEGFVGHVVGATRQQVSRLFTERWRWPTELLRPGRK